MPKKVLIVEDDALNVRLFEDLLESEGFDTVVSVDGAEALEAARGERPDLILMDIELPVESGLSVARRLKSDGELSGIPVIAVTAHAHSGEERTIRAGGCEDYISKPISIPGFMTTVRRYLH